MSRTLRDVARRISRELGTPKSVSYRIARKLNTLAASVDWAKPIADAQEAAERPGGPAWVRLAGNPQAEILPEGPSNAR